ncbi:hypothetical protein CJF32_00003634 [Rutstroemia sp. NJR-2017a WRK4]|nr:hypothetical protein CJF32_00003634 [Rutstroemia sp. NJR-2017a WRK4]
MLKKGVNIITLAILIVVIMNTVHADNFALLEWLIVFPMVLLLPLSALATFSDVDGRGNVIGSGFMFLNWGLFAVLQPWIWFTLLDRGYRSTCEVKGFIYADFDLYDPAFVSYAGVFAAFSCAIGSLCFIILIVFIALCMLSTINSTAGDILLSISTAWSGCREILTNLAHSRLLRVVSHKTLRKMRCALRIIWGLSGISILVFTQLVIKGNDIEIVHITKLSTGQIIPLIVGLCTFFSTAWEIYEDRAHIALVIAVTNRWTSFRMGRRAAQGEADGIPMDNIMHAV